MVLLWLMQLALVLLLQKSCLFWLGRRTFQLGIPTFVFLLGVFWESILKTIKVPTVFAQLWFLSWESRANYWGDFQLWEPTVTLELGEQIRQNLYRFRESSCLNHWVPSQCSGALTVFGVALGLNCSIGFRLNRRQFKCAFIGFATVFLILTFIKSERCFEAFFQLIKFLLHLISSSCKQIFSGCRFVYAVTKNCNVYRY